jgi:hypothetical protein
MKLYRNVDQHVKLCTWGFACGFILFCRSYCHWLKEHCNFQLVSNVAQNLFDIGPWNFTGMLISMFNCPSGYFRVNKFNMFRLIVVDLGKINNFQLVSHVAQKVFDPVSWNFTGMLISMWSCAPGVWLVDFLCFVWVIVLDLVDIAIFNLWRT